MKNNISIMTLFKWYPEVVSKNAEGIRSVNVNVNGIFAVSVNMALSMFILEKHFFVVVSAIILLDRNERTANSHIALTTSMLLCQNTVGSHTCSCKAGYTGNGKQCRGKNSFKEIQKHAF